MLNSAEDELVKVTSIRPIPRMDLMSCQVGPMATHYQAELPLWAALILLENSLVHLVKPDWMDEEKLREAHKFEQDEEEFSSSLPFYYYEMFQTMGAVPGALEDVAGVRELINAIHYNRMRKIEEKLKEPEKASFRNIGSIELERIRDVWQEVLRLKTKRAPQRHSRKRNLSRESGLGIDDLALDDGERPIRRLRMQ
ncbi:hypothetical protein BSKO_00042 [Bryopsis sp. KO-2023]|nr:hypothetical protein BSKO_00042 [Bryopsis sp. KO-2023]